MKKIFKALALVLLIPFTAIAAPQEQDARLFVHNSGYALIDALQTQDLEQKYATLDNLFDEKADTYYIAKFVLGQYYREFDEQQKQQYHALFNRYIKSLYKNYPLDFETKNLNFDIVSVKKNNDFFDVGCLIDLPEKYRNENMQNVKVEFKLKTDDDQLKFVDFKIGEASMLLTLRSRFVQMMKDSDEEPSWFLQDFEDLTISNEAQVRQE